MMNDVKQTRKNWIGAGKPGPGQPKGSPNRNTKALREMILGALDDAGGQEYLAQQAIENPGPFMTLLGKVLPKSVDLSPEDKYAHMDDEALIREAERLAASLGYFKHEVLPRRILEPTCTIPVNADTRITLSTDLPD